MSDTYISDVTWLDERPRVLVIACSDGRLQEAVDEYLGSLGIQRYDRLYAPGGPGALATSGLDFVRSGQFRKECAFLVDAHRIEEVIMLFHGPAEDGPSHALCADYLRKLPSASAGKVDQQQRDDIPAILRDAFSQKALRVRIVRCEVRGDGRIQFVSLETDQTKKEPGI
jgi:hypothetical protein